MSEVQNEHKLLTVANRRSVASQDSVNRRASTIRIEEGEITNLRRLATQRSQRSKRCSSAYSFTAHAPEEDERSLIIDPDDPALNPQAPAFDLEKWLRWVIKGANDDGITNPHASIVFKNLNVSGSGSSVQLQETVMSTFSILTQMSEKLRKRRSPSKLILKNFNGLLASGQLLLVLGRPGAGCSTFLKTLCGQVHGLNVDEKSVLHYNGKLLQAAKCAKALITILTML